MVSSARPVTTAGPTRIHLASLMRPGSGEGRMARGEPADRPGRVLGGGKETSSRPTGADPPLVGQGKGLARMEGTASRSPPLLPERSDTSPPADRAETTCVGT